MDNDQITVLVVFAMPDNQKVLELKVNPAATVADIVVQSNISAFFPDFDFSKPKVGIFNRTVKLSDTCRDGDRIEIYRPLLADPKAARLKRAQRAKDEGRADKVTGGRVNPQRQV
jgi:putative ubiquitin-RnfH superfamily antitoxin RatB of RatAB toxin-antitoxin module